MIKEVVRKVDLDIVYLDFFYWENGYEKETWKIKKRRGK